MLYNSSNVVHTLLIDVVLTEWELKLGVPKTKLMPLGNDYTVLLLIIALSQSKIHID